MHDRQGMTFFRLILAAIFAFVATGIHTSPSFDSASLTLSDNKPNVPLDFNITFRPTRTVGVNEIIVVRLPRFTMGLSENKTAQNETYGNVLIAPSYFFIAKWVAGYNNYDEGNIPYRTAELHIMPLYNVTCAKLSTYTITVFKENGIGAVCGFPSSETVNATGMFVYPFKPFEILTAVALESPTAMPTQMPTNPTAAPSASPTFTTPTANPTANPTQVTPTAVPTYAPTSEWLFYHNDSYAFDTYAGVGKGCQALGQCTKLGQCDYCEQKCYCFDGFGSATDLVGTGRDLLPDCSSRVCPAGKAIADIPSAANQAHALAECSNRGRCNRQSGQCQCFPPFTGAACEKMSCPNACSGHGACLSMGELSRTRALENSRRIKFEYGSSEGFATTAWDWDVMQGCLCDSAWPVGYGDGETQLAEYFGADCSLRRCPSGDDPYTSVDETNCYRLSQVPGDPERGYFGNKCYVECSRRGTCNYQTGTCTCFPGSWGTACENIANAGRRSWDASADQPSFALAGRNDSIIVEGN